MAAFASGEQYELTLRSDGRSTRAVITEVGAAIRRLSVDGVALTPGHDASVRPPFYSGAVLVPWPSRVRDGRWDYAGRTEQLAITEPRLGNALHGLLCDTAYRVVERTKSGVTLGAQVYPQQGYPFHLDTQVRYDVVNEGLQVTHTVRNVGPVAAPVGLGGHPFLSVGDVPADQLTLTVAADRHIDVDDRLCPIGVSSVHGTKWDMRGGGVIAELDLDDAWTGLHFVDGGSTHTLRAPDGRSVSLWADQEFGYVQVFTTRRYPRDAGFVTAVAVEPMTAPADAFNSGAGLRWVQPDDAWSASWAIRYRDGSQ